MSGAAPLQDPGTGLGRGAGGEDIVDQQHRLAGDLGGPTRVDLESLADVAAPLLGPKTGLRTRPSVAAQEIRGQVPAGCPSSFLWRRANNGAGQQESLVISARQETPPMKRHGRDQVGLGQKLRSGPRHPAAAGARDVGPVTMLERQDQTPALRVVGQRRAGPAKSRAAGKTAGAQRLVADMFGEGIAAARALGR